MDNSTHDVRPIDTEAMTVTAPGDQVAARIAFAERWLVRARAQCQDGNVAGGLLTLSLADAEVRYALEAGGWPSRVLRRRAAYGRVSWIAVAAAAAAALVLWTLGTVPLPAPVSAGPTDGPPIVRLPSHVGTLLATMAVPTASAVHAQSAPAASGSLAASSPVRTMPARRAAPQRPAAAAPMQSIAPAVPAVAIPAPTVAPVAPAPTRPSTVTPLPVISEVDLIEMVLAADRTLRGTSP